MRMMNPCTEGRWGHHFGKHWGHHKKFGHDHQGCHHGAGHQHGPHFFQMFRFGHPGDVEAMGMYNGPQGHHGPPGKHHGPPGHHYGPPGHHHGPPGKHHGPPCNHHWPLRIGQCGPPPPACHGHHERPPCSWAHHGGHHRCGSRSKSRSPGHHFRHPRSRSHSPRSASRAKSPRTKHCECQTDIPEPPTCE